MLIMFVLRKYQWIFESWLNFVLFLSTSSALSVKTRGNRFPASCRSMSVTVLCSTNGFFVLTLRVFIFFKFRSITAFFMLILFPGRIITFLRRPFEEKNIWESAQRCKKAYLDNLIVFVWKLMLFGLRHSYHASFLLFFFVFVYLCFSFCCCTPQNQKPLVSFASPLRITLFS